jgi:ABC-type multidrug transport system ATPase subunit
MNDTAALEASSLSRRYGSTWALRDCSLSLPTARVIALVGPNGAGKTTLLHLATGLLQPTGGSIRVLGEVPGANPEILGRVGFVAQEMPLYRTFTVAEMLRFGERLNPTWDQQLAVTRLESLSIPLAQKVGTLSGGQRGQVSLAIALAKRPELLLLDEPLASLDPLARRDFLAALMESVAEHGVSIVLSSHLVSDLERVCDHLVVLRNGSVAVDGGIGELIRSHRLVSGPRHTGPLGGVGEVIDRTDTDRQTVALVRIDGPVLDPAWVVREVDLEEVVLGYLGAREGSSAPADPTLRALRSAPSEVGS